MLDFWVVLLVAGLSLAAGYLVRRFIAEARLGSAERAARDILDRARGEAEAKRRELAVEAREAVHRLREDFEREVRDRRGELQRQEQRLGQKEESLDRKSEALERREESLHHREQETERTATLVQELHARRIAELERVAGLSSQEARELLLKTVEDEIQQDIARLIRDREAEAREEADRRAHEITALAVQRCAADHVTETTVSVV
ncbi:MAG: Rnase Y domain-containing protein, partial [bacterium]|nr:Rnase Y domain-containing protein [bacterium]